MSDVTASIAACFANLEDPRVQGRCTYPLIEIITIAMCGIITGAEGWAEIETFGKSREDWLRQLLPLEHGIPSHDTFGDVFALLDAAQFQQSFSRWVEQVFRLTEGEVVGIDGKTARHSYDKGIGKDAIHLVSAWANSTGISLGQVKVADKSNEITAIPDLLQRLHLSGCIVTIDAMGCQKKIAQAIVAQNADYVLALKSNQGQLEQDVIDWFAHADQVQFQNLHHDYHKTVNKAHGRIEIRECWVIDDPIAFDYLRHYAGWAGLKSIVRICRERRVQDQTQRETSYYISSLAADAASILAAIRQHWGIENQLHWVMDVTFREDDSRVRQGHAAQNLVTLRHMALNILKKDKSKGSLRQKRYRAALDGTFLLKLLSQV